jgi:hypothetical protein
MWLAPQAPSANSGSRWSLNYPERYAAEEFITRRKGRQAHNTQVAAKHGSRSAIRMPRISIRRIARGLPLQVGLTL